MQKSVICFRAIALVIVAMVWASAAGAVEPGERLSDPGLEARARALSAELRCLVCQNQSIDDSNAGLARDLRVLVRERISAGDTDKEVLDYVVSRYGKFVLLRPPFDMQTLLLWLAPLLLLIAALTYVYLAMRRGQAAVSSPAGLTADEQARVDQLLKDK
ncbi:MAG: cytochrome c-type biogenesis protein [Pseudomonadota bacterium]